MADAETAVAHPAVRVLVGLVTTASCVVTGAILGIVFVKLFVPKRGMGWDQIADALGGLMLGAALGLVLGVVLAIRLPPRRQLVAILIAVAIFGACWLGLYLTKMGTTQIGSAVDQLERGDLRLLNRQIEPAAFDLYGDDEARRRHALEGSDRFRSRAMDHADFPADVLGGV